MILLLDKIKLAFIGVPKCMTTTMTTTFYEWEYGEPYKAENHGGKFPHGFWKERAEQAGLINEPPSLDLLDGYETFTVVRDPFGRCVSAYANKVVGEKVVDKAAKTPFWQNRFGKFEKEYVPVPSADFFFENIETYRRLNRSVRHHTDPFSVFLGPDLSRIDHVFKIEEVDKIEAFVSDRLGRPMVLEQRQRSQNKPKVDALTDAARAALLKFVKPDYDLLRDYYQPAA